MKTGRMMGWVALLLVLVCLFVASDATFASEQKNGEEDPLAFTGLKRYDLGIYTLIVFGALLFILGKFAWKPIMDGLEKRESTIREHHANAEKAHAEAQETLAKLQKQLADANDQVRAMIEEARREGQALKESMKAEAAKDIQSERDRTRREIETARDQALQEIWTKAVQIAALVSTKAVRREMTVEDHKRLIDDALAELKESLSSGSAKA